MLSPILEYSMHCNQPVDQQEESPRMLGKDSDTENEQDQALENGLLQASAQSSNPLSWKLRGFNPRRGKITTPFSKKTLIFSKFLKELLVSVYNI